MNYRTSDGVGGDRGIGHRTSYQTPMNTNHAGTTNVDTAQRVAERTKLVRSAMNYSARQLLIALHPSQRTESESMKLKDMARDRCAVTDENLAFLMVLQDRCDAHFLSENQRAVEVKGREVRECIHDLSESEQRIDAEADLIQLKLAREKSPARLQQITEIGPRIIAAWRRMVDVAHVQLGRTA